MVHEDIELHELTPLVAAQLIVKRRVPAGAGFQRVEEIIDNLVERHFVFQNRPVFLNILRALVHASPLLAECHDRTDILLREHDLSLNHRLLHVLDLGRIRHIGRVREIHLRAIRLIDLVNDRRSRRDEIEVILALESLRHDIEMQESEEAAAETKAEGRRSLRLILKRRVVELKLLKRVPQVRVLRRVRRINAAVNHRLRLLVAGERLRARPVKARHRIADACLLEILDTGLEISDGSCPEPIGRNKLARTEDADLRDREVSARLHHADVVSSFHRAVKDTDKDNDAAVGVIDAVEDQRLERPVRLS